MTRMSLTGYLSVQLDRFLKPFVQAVPCNYAKPVKELVFLILGAPSIMVWQLGRRMSWGPREMIHREKRLCRHAKTKSFGDMGLSAALRVQAAEHLRQDSLILLDTSDIAKPHARKMEHLGIVHDGSAKTNGPGHWLVGAFLRLKRGRIVPMRMRCFSVVHPGIKSFNAVIVQAISQLKEVLREGDFFGDSITWLNGYLSLLSLILCSSASRSGLGPHRGAPRALCRTGNHLPRARLMHTMKAGRTRRRGA